MCIITSMHLNLYCENICTLKKGGWRDRQTDRDRERAGAGGGDREREGGGIRNGNGFGGGGGRERERGREGGGRGRWRQREKDGISNLVSLKTARPECNVIFIPWKGQTEMEPVSNDRGSWRSANVMHRQTA